MRYKIVLITVAILILCWIVKGRAVPDSSNPSQPVSDYQVAYERWCQAIEAHPDLGEPFWVRTDIGPSDLQEAIKGLLSYGPNMTSFLAQEMKKEKDQLRLYRLVLLLNAVSGINLYYESGEESFYAATPRFRDRFVADWETGKYLNASVVLQKNWTYLDARSRRTIDPKRLSSIRRYGVFALPFILENLEKHNSPELFAAFLIITGESDLYSDYLERPNAFLPAPEQKLEFVKAWVNRNESKIDKLEGLHRQIKTLTAR
jgi:hypothetical protein